jgi:PhnB protein
MSWQREGFSSVTPYLIVDEVEDLLEFLVEALDADVLSRQDRPDGSVIRAEVEIGDSMLILSEPTEELEPAPAALYLYVEDCDDVFARTLDAGAAIFYEPETSTRTGERTGAITDPSGNLWVIATHVGHVEEDEFLRIEELTAAAEPPDEPDEPED